MVVSFLANSICVNLSNVIFCHHLKNIMALPMVNVREDRERKPAKPLIHGATKEWIGVETASDFACFYGIGLWRALLSRRMMEGWWAKKKKHMNEENRICWRLLRKALQSARNHQFFESHIIVLTTTNTTTTTRSHAIPTGRSNRIRKGQEQGPGTAWLDRFAISPAKKQPRFAR